MGRKVIFEFDPFEIAGIEPNPETRAEVLREVGEFVVGEIVGYTIDRKSCVAGYGNFQRLSEDYKTFKRRAGHPPVPNLLFSGDMLEAIKASSSGNKVRVGITGKQGDKADGHCNFSGDSSLPLRRFIPNADDGENFKSPIVSGIRRIVEAGQ